MAAPNGDIWAVGLSKSQLLHFPGADLSKGRIVCEGRKDAEPWWGRSRSPSTNRSAKVT